MLLDTHVLLWLLTEPDRLGPTTSQRLRSAPRVLVSAVSIAELQIKAMLGKLELPAGFEERLTTMGLEQLALTHTHAMAIDRLPELTRHDPFDRLLLAQASVDGTTFLTADGRLLALGLSFVADATN